MNAPFRKIILQRQPPNLYLEDLEIWRIRLGLHAANTSIARASTCCIHSVIGVGCTPNCIASSATGLTPLDRDEGH